MIGDELVRLFDWSGEPDFWSGEVGMVFVSRVDAEGKGVSPLRCLIEVWRIVSIVAINDGLKEKS